MPSPLTYSAGLGQLKRMGTAERAIRALKNIIIDGNTQRIWQILNKSPLIHFNQLLKEQFHPRILRVRKDEITQATLSAHEVTKLSELEKYGFVEISELIQGEALQRALSHVETLLHKSREVKVEARVQTKTHWIRLTDLEFENTQKAEHPFVQLALLEPILKITGKYLGQAPLLQSVLLTHSIPTGAPMQSSQLWHVDNDHCKMLKFFIYFSDVETDEDGPFVFINAEESKKIRNSFFKAHLSDSKVFSFVDRNSVTAFRGRKLTAFLCDTTRCYHMGSRVAAGHERLMLTSLFMTFPSPYPNGEKTNLSADRELQGLQKLAIYSEG